MHENSVIINYAEARDSQLKAAVKRIQHRCMHRLRCPVYHEVSNAKLEEKTCRLIPSCHILQVTEEWRWFHMFRRRPRRINLLTIREITIDGLEGQIHDHRIVDIVMDEITKFAIPFAISNIDLAPPDAGDLY